MSDTIYSGVCRLPGHGAWASRLQDRCPHCAGVPMVRISENRGIDFGGTQGLSAENARLRAKLDRIREIVDQVPRTDTPGPIGGIREVLDQ